MDVVQLTAQEKELIEKAAQQCGMTVEQYLAYATAKHLQQASKPFKQATLICRMPHKPKWH